MLRVWKVDGKKLTALDGLSAYDCAKDAGWIDMLVPSAEEDKAVEACTGISIPTKEDMEEIELSARLYEENGAEYMTMIAVAQMNQNDPVKTPVTFIVHNNTLITVRYSELTPFNRYTAWAQKAGKVQIPSAHGIMLDILESFINRIADSIELLGTDVEQISRAIFRSKKTKANDEDIKQVSITKVGAQGDLLGMLRESLATLSRVLAHQHTITGEENKPLKAKMAVMNRDVLSLADHANFLSGKMNFLLDATLGMINLEQNQIIKIFSIAAVVFLPPTLIASVYGMNFHHMPELDEAWGYPIAVCAMVLSAIAPLVYFKKKGWL